MYLLDTCVLIWLLSCPDELSERAKSAIISAKKAYISFASLWKISIKQSIGKLALHKKISQIAEICRKTNIEILYPTPSELDILQHLPKIHGDPFDRLIVAQAQSRDLVVITSDNFIPQYGISILWQILKFAY